MKEINVLTPAIYNRLAAGEVVENPASIVKELIENSIDAHANKITIQITHGGIDEILVTDNGEGVDENNLLKVFMPHATSKIKQIDDIDHITSLGFRGEAMASIAAVAKVEFTSKPPEQSYAACVNEQNEIKRVGANFGTTVRVSNLFYNTPARKKFLRSVNTEKNNVTQVIQNVIFAHPELLIRYIVDDKIMLDYQGQGLATAMEQIYGIDQNDLLPVECQAPAVAVSGLISKPDVTKVNRERQVIIINGRVINGGLLAAMVNEAMANYLPPKEYAIYVLHFTVATDQVDVNVHPQKKEVRFENNGIIISLIWRAITETIEHFFLSRISDVVKTEAVDPVNVSPIPTAKMSNPETPQIVGKSFNPANTKPETVVMQSFKLFEQPTDVLQSAPNILNNLPINDITKPEQINLLPTNQFTVLGQVFETYLIVRTAEALLIIDQHAMAERVNYDKFRAQIDQNAVQSQIMLAPLIIKLTPKELSKFEAIKPLITAIGFDCDEFGDTAIRVTAIPAIMSQTAVNDFMSVLLNDKEIVSTELSDLMKHKVATMACKASIRAGDVLSTPQIEKFLEHYFKTKNVPLCPHGRPIMLVFNQSKLESLFARK